MSLIKMSSDTSLAFSDLIVVVPYKFSSNEKEVQIKKVEDKVLEPVLLTTPAKDKRKKMFDIPPDFLKMSFDDSEELMVITLSFNEKGWDRFSYSFLQSMAVQVQKEPKAFGRSYRAFANLMKKLTPEPIGSAKNDVPRKIVIDQTTQQMAPMIRDILSDRLKKALDDEK